MSPLGVQLHLDRVGPAAPRHSGPHPLITAGLVEVDDVLSGLYAARQADHEAPHFASILMLGLLVLVLHHNMAHSIRPVELR